MQIEKENPEIEVKIPAKEMTTDNSVMIAMACYINALKNPKSEWNKSEIKACGNLELSQK